MAQTTYGTMFVWADQASVCSLWRKKIRKGELASTRPVGFAAGKYQFEWNGIQNADIADSF